MTNDDREYNASLEKKLTMEEFVLVLEKCKELSKKKYDLKKFNCYEYALEVFNSLPGIERLPFPGFGSRSFSGGVDPPVVYIAT